MAQRIRWWWRAAIVCAINVVGIAVATEIIWGISRGEPFAWRWIYPRPIVFQFRGFGVLLAVVAVCAATLLGFTVNHWLLRRRFRASLSEAVRRIWHSLRFWRRAWLWRALAAVATVIAVALFWAIYVVDLGLSYWLGTMLHAWHAAHLGPAQKPTLTAPEWASRTNDVMLLTAGAVLGLIVLRLLCLRAAPNDGLLRCLKCDHILQGLAEPRCPRCGQPI